MGKLILVIGGCRSGKSSFAQGLCETLAASGHKAYIAASPVTDPEMAERIARHQRDRQGRNWRTLEETVDLAGVLRACWQEQVVLIDCLTLWVSNLLLAESRPGQLTEDAAALRSAPGCPRPHPAPWSW
jgi:adenosylcobinamide kinase/adenosylcobinamide-phosphate guanylyltransferase